MPAESSYPLLRASARRRRVGLDTGNQEIEPGRVIRELGDGVTRDVPPFGRAVLHREREMANTGALQARTEGESVDRVLAPENGKERRQEGPIVERGADRHQGRAAGYR